MPRIDKWNMRDDTRCDVARAGSVVRLELDGGTYTLMVDLNPDDARRLGGSLIKAADAPPAPEAT